MKLIAGLGNPENKYDHTRHNIGFRVIDSLLLKYRAGHLIEEKKFKAQVKIIPLDNENTILVKPQTYMNNSGTSIKAIVDYYKIPPHDILIIHDDIDLPIGQIKLHKNRGAAGHKGVQSIIDSLKTKDFSRIRIGIANESQEAINTEQYVLEKFSSDDEMIITPAIKKATALIAEAF